MLCTRSSLQKALTFTLLLLTLSTTTSLTLAEESGSDFCKMTESSFYTYLGGAAAGAAITAQVAADSSLLIIANSGAILITAPAIAPVIAGSALTAAGAYGAMRAYCNAGAAIEIAQLSQDRINDMRQTATDNTSRSIEIIATEKEEATGVVADMFCGLFGDCP